MKKQNIPTLTASALGFLAIYIIVVGAWGIFPGARSQTLTPQDQVSAAELSAALDAQREASANLNRSASFDRRLQELIEKARKKGTVSVMVKVRAAFRPEGLMSNAAETLAQRQVIGEAQDQMLSWLRYVPSTLKRYDYIPYISASLDETGLRQLQSSAEAMDISENKPLRLAMAESLHRVGAPRAWAGQFKGTGKTIAVLDSGVDKNHSWLSGKVVSEACYSTTDPAKQYSSVCPGGPTVTESTDPGSGVPCAVPGLEDVGNCGHGTHIAGIAAGRGGVAYDAKIISIQVMSKVTDTEACRNQAQCLLTDRDDVVSALLRVYALQDTYDIAAVNVSLAGDPLAIEPFPDTCDDEYQAMTDAINLLRSVNIPTVIASGNDLATDAISFPACVSSAISVGATGDGSAPNAPVDAILPFSNSASFLKLLAPGGLITSSVPGVGFADASGTSMAAAHVSGAWAMLKEKYPDATVDQVLNKLTSFGRSITDPRNSITKPRIQIDDALEVTVPPDTWIGEYYNNPNLENNPVLVRDDGGGFINRNFSGASPAPGIGTENYSIRWTRTVTLTEGNYRFSLTSDDGARLYIDDQLKIDQWPNSSPSATTNVNVDLTAGSHDIRLEYYQSTGPAQIRLTWGLFNPACSQTVAAGRWKGEYFNNVNLAGSPAMVRDDGLGPLNFDWTDGSPSSTCNVFADYFSARWTRTVNLVAARYRFAVTNVDDGVRLYIDGQLKIDQWILAAGTHTVEVDLSADDHVIKMEFYEQGGLARASLSWEPLPPNPPSNLVAIPPSVTQINLSWVDNSATETGFKIERSTGGGFSQIAIVGANITTYVDPSLADGTTYTYRVRAYSSAGDSAYSNQSSATTRLPGPSNLVASAASTTHINLNWVDNSTTESGFKIERLSGGSFSQIGVVGANVTTYSDSSLAPGTTHTYRVRAYNSTGDSEYSNPSSATTHSCSYAVSPTFVAFLPGMFWGNATVSAGAGCAWSASSNVDWIIILEGASGSGNGTVVYQVVQYQIPDGFRFGTITVAGQTVTITQYGPCGTCLSEQPQSNALNQSAMDERPRGLTARYFNNTTLSGQPALQRTDPAVNFDWAGKRPDNLLSADGFSARWSGQLVAPLSEAYTFYLISDGGARLWVNNQLLIDRWQPPFEPQPHSVPVKLKANAKADIRLEYYNAGGEGMIRLLWSSASTPKQIIPLQYLYPEAATNESAPTDVKQQTGMLLPPESDASPKATRPQPSVRLASPLSRVGLALLIACGVLALLLRINRGQSRERLATAATCAGLRLRKRMNMAIGSGAEMSLRMFAALRSGAGRGVSLLRRTLIVIPAPRKRRTET